jgi:hypothetical protein
MNLTAQRRQMELTVAFLLQKSGNLRIKPDKIRVLCKACIN